jgi:hypothetical protein
MSSRPTLPDVGTGGPARIRHIESRRSQRAWRSSCETAARRTFDCILGHANGGRGARGDDVDSIGGACVSDAAPRRARRGTAHQRREGRWRAGGLGHAVGARRGGQRDRVAVDLGRGRDLVVQRQRAVRRHRPRAVRDPRDRQLDRGARAVPSPPGDVPRRRLQDTDRPGGPGTFDNTSWELVGGADLVHTRFGTVQAAITFGNYDRFSNLEHVHFASIGAGVQF